MFVEGSMAGGVDESWTSPRIGKRSRSKPSSGLQQIADLKFSVQLQFKKKTAERPEVIAITLVITLKNS